MEFYFFTEKARSEDKFEYLMWEDNDDGFVGTRVYSHRVYVEKYSTRDEITAFTILNNMSYTTFHTN